MEDVAFSKLRKRRSPPACLRERVLTSGRRWEQRGVLRTLFRVKQIAYSDFSKRIGIAAVFPPFIRGDQGGCVVWPIDSR